MRASAFCSSGGCVGRCDNAVKWADWHAGVLRAGSSSRQPWRQQQPPPPQQQQPPPQQLFHPMAPMGGGPGGGAYPPMGVPPPPPPRGGQAVQAVMVTQKELDQQFEELMSQMN
eukprot:497531-Pyramimonas_sp.AAC.2